MTSVRRVPSKTMPKRREPPKPERTKARYPTPAEREEPVAIPLDFEEAVRGLLAVDPDEPPEGDPPA